MGDGTMREGTYLSVLQLSTSHRHQDRPYTEACPASSDAYFTSFQRFLHFKNSMLDFKFLNSSLFAHKNTFVA